MSTKTLFASFICGLIAMMAQSAYLQAAAPPLVGSWQFTLNPTTPPIPSIPIPGLATFTTDGSVIETDSTEVVLNPPSPGAAITYRTPGHGIWQRLPTGTNLYVQFISILANPDGTLNARSTTTMSVGVDSTGTMLSGTYTSQIVDPNGHVLQMSTGTVSGNIIPHPKFP